MVPLALHGSNQHTVASDKVALMVPQIVLVMPVLLRVPDIAEMVPLHCRQGQEDTLHVWGRSECQRWHPRLQNSRHWPLQQLAEV